MDEELEQEEAQKEVPKVRGRIPRRRKPPQRGDNVLGGVGAAIKLAEEN